MNRSKKANKRLKPQLGDRKEQMDSKPHRYKQSKRKDMLHLKESDIISLFLEEKTIRIHQEEIQK